jgi:Immunoglobulin-like domain of bacterial spore germination
VKLAAGRLLLVAALLAAPAPAAAAAAPGLTAARTRIGDHPAFVRVVVDFSGGDLGRQEPTAVDPAVADGAGRVEIVHPGVRAAARPVTALGVAVGVAQRAGRVLVRSSSAAGRFKYLAYDVLTAPERLVVDLWKSRVPAPAATILDDGCLRVTSFHPGPNVGIAGRALVPLFEGTVVVRLRGAGGRVLVERPLIADGGRWATSFGYGVARTRPATLEAVVESAKDGALSCLVQVPLMLRAG